MPSPTLVSVDEYIRTSYSPDCDYVDGEVLERNLGERDHSLQQKRMILYLGLREKQWGVEVFPQQRVQVKPNRFRIPDVCVTLGHPAEQILTQPPFICIEILSPEDRMSRIEERVDDYLAMGVPYVWVLDPATKRAWTITPADGWREVKNGALRTGSPAIEVPPAEIFAD